MIDFPYEEPCVATSLFCVLLYGIHMAVNYRIGIRYPNFTDEPKRKQTLVIIVLFFFFSFFCIDGDFFHFLHVVRYYNFVKGAYNYGEPIYGLITAMVNSNYLIFRMIVWGGAYVVYCLTAKRFGIPVYYAAVLLFAMYPITFTYARVTCALSIYFYGASFFCCPLKRNKYIGYVIGAILIYYSNLFHTSVILMAILTLAIYAPLNKKSLLIMFLLFPIIIHFTQDAFISLANEAGDMDNEGRAKRITRMAESENVGFRLSLSNPGVFLHRTLSYLAFYVPNLILMLHIVKNKTYMPSDVIGLFKITFAAFVISTVFYFVPYGGAVMVYRILFMTMIPITIITCKLKQLDLIPDKYYIVIIGFAIAYAIVRILYYVYSMIL